MFIPTDLLDLSYFVFRILSRKQADGVAGERSALPVPAESVLSEQKFQFHSLQ